MTFPHRGITIRGNSNRWIESMPVGAPIGNQNAAKSKRWEAALERAFAAWPNEPDSTNCSPLMIGLNKAAFNFVARTMAADADLGFFKETADRLDGKPAQAITGEGGAPLTITFIRKDENVL